MVDLRQFRQFIAVAEAMSFRRAAERLNMAQPPLTAAIRQMEGALGVALFERTNRIIGITPAGQVLLEEARRTVAQAERALALTRRAGAGTIGSLRLGLVAGALRYLLPMLLRFRATHPDVALEFQEATTARQLAGLIEDRLDLGLVVLPLPARYEGLIATTKVLSSGLVAALPAAHCLDRARARKLPLAALADEPWILFPADEGPGLHDRIMAACAQAGFTPQVAQAAVQMETIVGLVAAGLGVALVPPAFSENGRPGVAFRTVVGPGTPVAYEVALARRGSDDSPALRAFLSGASAA